MSYKEDVPPPITNALRGGPQPEATRKLPMPRYWRQTVDDAVEARGGIPRVAPSLFNKHLAILRDKYSDDEIRAGFRAFAVAVRSGMVDVRGKTAWFVFMGRREHWIPRLGAERLQFNDHPQQRMRLGATKEEPPG